MSRLDVVHDIDMNVVEDHRLLGKVWSFPKYATKDDACLC